MAPNELRGRVRIEVQTCCFRSARGYTLAAVVADEVAFWRSEESANPDVEVLRALQPALATIPGAMLVGISSPYARRGVLYDAHRRAWGKDGDTLVFKAPTRVLNPTIPEAVVAEAMAQDPEAACAEWLGEFRDDVAAFVSREAVEACVVPGRLELPRVAGVEHRAFVDPSGGSADSFTLGIAHDEDRDGQSVAVLDVVREVKPAFNPEIVVTDFAEVLGTYGVATVRADRYAGAWVAEAFARHDVTCEQDAPPKAELYAALLPRLMSRRVELLDDTRLVAQLVSLERRTRSGGRDAIDHPPSGHDDRVNAAAGALVGGETWSGGRGLLRWVADEYEKAMREGRVRPNRYPR